MSEFDDELADFGVAICSDGIIRNVSYLVLNKLKKENAKLRALVERGAKLMDADCGAQIDEFSYECEEALK